jgi:transposase
MTITPKLAEFAALIGIDWADQKHDVALQEADSSKRERLILKHTAEAIAEWANELRQRFGGRKVAIALEQSKGALIYALMAYDFIVIYRINPQSLSEFRKVFSPSGAKDDPVDADLLLELLVKHGEKLPAWVPDDVQTRTLDQLTRARRQAVELRKRMSNTLISTLKSYYPQALELVGEHIYSPLACAFLLKWSSLPELKKARKETVRSFYYANNSRRGDVIAKRIAFIETTTPLTTDAAVVDAGMITVQMLATQLRAIAAAIQGFDKKTEEVFATHPDAPIFKSFPGAGPVFAPRLLAAFGSNRSRYEKAASIQMYGGVAPVTERSGKSSWVHWRYACPKFLRQSFHEYANESIRHSIWAKTYYEQLMAKGKKHNAAIRAVAFKWIRIMFRCWKEKTPYDEVRYLRTLQKRGSYIFQRIDALTPKIT